MAKAFRMKIENDLDFDKYFKDFKKEAEEAKTDVGIQLINNIVNAEGGIALRPPILHGTLWGSGSVFVGSENVYVTPGQGGIPTPNTSHAGKEGEITIGFNTAYAKRWHYEDFTPGPISEQAGNVGNLYITKHLQADARELMMLFAMLVKKRTGG